MASIFKQIVDGIHAQADPLGILYIGIGDAINRTAVSYGIGRLATELHETVPHLVWIPTEGTMSAPSNIGGRLLGGQGGTRNRALLTREQRCQVQVWGGNFEQAETLWHNMLAAVWSYSSGSVAFGNHSWVTQTESGADYSALGELVTQDITLHIPVNEAAIAGLPLTILTAQDHTGIIELPTGPEVVC